MKLLPIALLACAACAVSPEIPGAVASEIAWRADAVADQLAEGDTCAAEAEAAALVEVARREIGAGSIPVLLEAELEDRITALERIRCVPSPELAVAEEPSPEEQEGRKKRKGRDRDREEDD